jgi:hypothetical protein
LQSEKCQRCGHTVEETEKCEVCHRLACNYCLDEGSGMCSDCAKAVWRDPERFLLCCDEDFEEKQLEMELKRRFKEVDEGEYETEWERQDAIDRVQEEIKEHRNELYDRSNTPLKNRSCFSCHSENISLFPDFVTRIYRFHCKCLNCGVEWTSEQRRF